MSEITYQEFIQNILDTRGRFACGDTYHERHHIVPKCMGGVNKESNLIDLYAREHYEAHRLLALENPQNDKLVFAWWNMSQCSGISKKRVEISGEEYEAIRILRRERISNLLSGRTFSEETIEKMKKSQRHRYENGNKGTFYNHRHTAETKEKIRQKRTGQKLSQEHKDKIRMGMLQSQKFQEYMQHNGKPVICDGMLFKSVTECARYYKLNDTTLHGYLIGSKKMPKRWELLGLRYYKD